MDVLPVNMKVVMIAEQLAELKQDLLAFFQLFAPHGFQETQLIKQVFRPFAPVVKQMQILFGVGGSKSFHRLSIGDAQAEDNGVL